MRAQWTGFVTLSDIYFTKEVKSENYYEAEHTHVMRSRLDGQNKTQILDLHFGKVTSLAVYRDFIYWTNMSTRGIQRLVACIWSDS